MKNTQEALISLQAPVRAAADAIFSYRFDPKTGEHILRLRDPVADHQHLLVRRPAIRTYVCSDLMLK